MPSLVSYFQNLILQGIYFRTLERLSNTFELVSINFYFKRPLNMALCTMTLLQWIYETLGIT